MPLAVGTVVAGYRIQAVLGAGGMGTVYLARHPTLPRSDALKLLSAELSQDERFRHRFTREADLAAGLNHRNIVTVFNRGETEDGQLWIAMEYVKGTAADELARPNLPPAWSIRIISDAARALDYAHSQRVLHRDVKPSNFLVLHPGVPDQERVLLADFGIARALDESSSITATGSAVFTAAYAAPEAVEGASVDHRADIYSLGCSLYRLLAGSTPYEKAGSLPAVLMSHVMAPIPRISAAVPDLPRGLDEVISRALAKNPDDRFPSAGALAAAAAAAITGSVPAQRRAMLSDTREWVTPPVGHDAPGTIGGSRAADPVPHTPTPQNPQAVRPRHRRLGLTVSALALAVVIAATIAGFAILGRNQGDNTAAYRPQTLTGIRGVVQLSQRPMAVAALGPGDADAVLSLGLEPVAIGGITGTLPSWLAGLIHSQSPPITIVGPDTVAARKPDLIIDTGDVDQPTYDKLAATAPTLTRQAGASRNWTWQAQLTWIATALGRTETADRVINDSTAQQAKLKSQHPAFAGKSITVVNFSGTATTVAVQQSAPAAYLEGLGFRYNARYPRGPDDSPVATVDPDNTFFHTQPTDVMLVCRTDPGAGGGGYNGLPTGFSTYNGIVVILDDPTAIEALNTGGPAAAGYLNHSLVSILAGQIH